jgi:rhamnosyl/mannosyltransferase
MILFLYRSKYIIVTSKKYLNSSWVLKLFLSKIKVIPIGIDVSQNNLKKKNIFRKKKYFIFVGNLRNYKGLDFLINAFKILKYNLVILGNGKLLNYVKTEIKNVDNIYHIKNANESTKIQLMRKSLSIILPSTDRRESFGVVLLEASFLKKPLITTNINTGTSFVNLHNKTGFICKPKCQKDIIKYCKIIYENSYLRKKLGKNAHQRYLKYFTKDKMIKKYINLFNQF